MKTKLAVIGLAMALGAWMAIANSPTVRSLEQRVSELEQMVGQLNQVVASQQQEIERFAPLADEMEIKIWDDGTKDVVVNCNMWIHGGTQSDKWFTCGGNIYSGESIYYLGDLVHWGN